ncbi:Chaperone protein DnaJ [Chlorella vulgaris]
MADPHAVLGIQPGSSKAEIKAAFRKKAMRHHPDMHATASEEVKKAHDAAFRVLNESYQSLMEGGPRPGQRSYPGRSGYGRGGPYGGGADYNPFTTSYRSGTGSHYTGSHYSGWRQYQRRRGFDFQGLFRSVAGISRASAVAATTLGLLLAGGVVLLEPLAGVLWAQNNDGKLFSSIEEDYRRKQQQQEQQRQQERQRQQQEQQRHQERQRLQPREAAAAGPQEQVMSQPGEQQAGTQQAVVEAQRLEAREQGAAVQQDDLSRPQERPHGSLNSNTASPSRLRPEPSDSQTQFRSFTFWLSRLSIMASFAPETSLKALDGMRAICSLWVVLVHCWMLWAVQLPYSELRDIGNASWLPWLATQGAVGADVFLVLSALLAMYHLLPVLEGSIGEGGSCWQAVLTYWRRRARRILPGYLLANVLIAVVFRTTPADLPLVASQARKAAHEGCPSGQATNLLFLTNTQSMTQACGAHFWTTSVAVHLYIALPLLLCALRPRLLGFRRRLVLTLAAAVVAGAAWRYWSASRFSFFLPIRDRRLPEEEANLNTLLDAVYLPTLSRVTELAVGASLGLLLRSPSAISWVIRRSMLVSGTAFTFLSTYLVIVSNGNLYPPQDAPLLPVNASQFIAAFLMYGGPYYACLVASILLALICRTDPLHAAAARLLSSRIWDLPAALSYYLYLFHEPLKFLLMRSAPQLLPHLAAQAPLMALAALTAATTAAGYGAAGACWLLLERGPRKPQS